MSRFSYISFPREVDASCLISKVDPSKVFTVSQIKGTEFDHGNLDAFPDDAKVYVGDILTDFQGMRIYENRDASFQDVFTNRFVYCLEATFELLDAEKYKEECMAYLLDDECDKEGMGSLEESMRFIDGMIERNKDEFALCRKQLYALIQNNIEPNEMVEIYSEWVSGLIAQLGPAKERIVLDASQVLTSELLNREEQRVIQIRRNP